MNFWKEQRYQCILQRSTQKIVELERERNRLFNELNETRVKYESLRCKHQDLCKNYNGIRKKYLKKLNKENEEMEKAIFEFSKK